MRTIAIGDIHGCARALAALIEAVEPGPRDVIVTLGDYVDRGPDSRGVIDQLLELAGRCRLKSLLGNHEQIMLNAIDDEAELDYWLQCGGRATLASYGGTVGGIPAEHVEFLRNLRRYYQTPEHFFVHANYVWDMELDEQPDFILLWEHLAFFVPARHQSGKTAVVGHTPQPSGEILDLGHVICIDTYCVGGGWLTALEVETGRMWQADREGRVR